MDQWHSTFSGYIPGYPGEVMTPLGLVNTPPHPSTTHSEHETYTIYQISDTNLIWIHCELQSSLIESEPWLCQMCWRCDQEYSENILFRNNFSIFDEVYLTTEVTKLSNISSSTNLFNIKIVIAAVATEMVGFNLKCLVFIWNLYLPSIMVLHLEVWECQVDRVSLRCFDLPGTIPVTETQSISSISGQKIIW